MQVEEFIYKKRAVKKTHRIAAALIIAGFIPAATAFADHSWSFFGRQYHWTRPAGQERVLEVKVDTWRGAIGRDKAQKVIAGLQTWNPSSVIEFQPWIKETPRRFRNNCLAPKVEGRIRICIAEYDDPDWSGAFHDWRAWAADDGAHFISGAIFIDTEPRADGTHPGLRKLGCHEIGHALGLAHRFGDDGIANSGDDPQDTCLSYIDSDDALDDPPSASPDVHDFEQLELQTHEEG